MTFHPARFLGAHEIGSARAESVSGGVKSIGDDCCVTKRNFVAEDQRTFVTCPQCGALREPDIDCVAENCPGSPDMRLFAPFMSPYRIYDLSNWYDRDSIRATVEKAIRRYADWRHTYPNSEPYQADTWSRLMNVRDRLNALDEAALPEKRGAR